MGDVWLQYAPSPEPPDVRKITADEWRGLIDDLALLVEIALGFRNDEPMFVAEMERQLLQMNR